MGGTTKAAMRLLDEGKGPREVGQHFVNPHEVGSGTAMRVAPLGWFYRNQLNIMGYAVTEDAQITHVHPEARAAALAVAHATATAGMVSHPHLWLRGTAEYVRYYEPVTLVGERLFHAATLVQDRYTPEQVCAAGVFGNRGNAWQIAVSALYCVAANWTSFVRAVHEAVALGGDTDTRGAVTGAIAGAMHGLDKIPGYLREGLYKFDELAALDEQLTKASPYGRE